MVKEIKTIEDFEKLKDEWNKLYNSNSNNTPFQSWEWLYFWWKYIGYGNDLFILMVYDEDSNLCGIAPLFLQRTYKFFPFKNINFIGEKRTDYLDFLLVPGKEAKFFNNLFSYFANNENRWSMIKLGDMPASSVSFKYIYSSLSEKLKYFVVENDRICVTIFLPSDWEIFIKSLGKRSRKDVNYDRRYLAKSFKVDFKVYSDSINMKKAFDDLTIVYRKRWMSEKGITRFDKQRMYNFEREVCYSVSKNGSYRVFILYLNDKPVAALSGFVFNKKLYGDSFVHDPEYRKFSVGNVLLGLCIEYCIKQELSEFDLSRGNESYKYKWKGSEKRNLHVKIFNSRRAIVFSQIIDYFYEVASQSRVLNFLYRSYNRIFLFFSRVTSKI